MGKFAEADAEIEVNVVGKRCFLRVKRFIIFLRGEDWKILRKGKNRKSFFEERKESKKEMCLLGICGRKIKIIQIFKEKNPLLFGGKYKYFLGAEKFLNGIKKYTNGYGVKSKKNRINAQRKGGKVLQN